MKPAFIPLPPVMMSELVGGPPLHIRSVGIDEGAIRLVFGDPAYGEEPRVLTLSFDSDGEFLGFAMAEPTTGGG